MHLVEFNKKEKVLDKKFKKLESLLKKRQEAYSIQDNKMEAEQIKLERLPQSSQH